jgi:hypothetical protein
VKQHSSKGENTTDTCGDNTVVTWMNPESLQGRAPPPKSISYVNSFTQVSRTGKNNLW